MDGRGLSEHDLVFRLGSNGNGGISSGNHSFLPRGGQLSNYPHNGEAGSSNANGEARNIGDILLFMENSRRESQENQNRFMEAIINRLAPGVLAQPVVGVSLGQFLQTQPPSFPKAMGPLEAHDWLLEIEKKLETVGCSDEEKVRYAAHQLKGLARAWWSNFKHNHAENEPVTWAVFKQAFTLAFVPNEKVSIKKKKREFRNLSQGNKRLGEYVHQFTELSRYAPEDVNTEEKKVEKFMEGLHPFLRMHLRPLMITKFQDLVNRAIVLEDEHSQLGEERRKKARFEQRPMTQQTRTCPQMPLFKPSPTNYQVSAPKCGKCGGRHLTKDCLKGSGVCFNCGKEGHHKANCPYPTKPTVQPAQCTQVINQPVRRGGGGQVNTAGRGAGRGGPSAGTAKLNYVNAEQLGAATDIITGIKQGQVQERPANQIEPELNPNNSDDPQEYAQGSLDDGYAYADWDDDYEEASQVAVDSYGGWDE